MGDRFSKCAVASIDILGASDRMMSDEMAETFIDNLYGFQDEISDTIGETFELKTFSDNVLLSSDTVDVPTVSNFIKSLAWIQLNVLCHQKLLMRGGLVIDKFYKSEHNSGKDFVIGKSLVCAHELESKFAIYPRIIVSNEVFDLINSDSHSNETIICDADQKFVDYLQVTLDSENFVNRELLKKHASALIQHINETNNSNIDNIDCKKWDSIRSKDVWVLAYHNDFCHRYDAEDCKIEFKEVYCKGKVIIQIIDTEQEELNERTRIA